LGSFRKNCHAHPIGFVSQYRPWNRTPPSSFGKNRLRATRRSVRFAIWVRFVIPRAHADLVSEPSPYRRRFSARPSTDKLGFFMAISEDLLEILVCPVCKAKVVLKEDGSGLKCVQCNRVYPVRDDIPVMLVDQATIEP
jgi:uncharacterized protein